MVGFRRPGHIYYMLLVHIIHLYQLYTVGSKRVRTRCGNCDGCKRSDCGYCKYCKDKKKYGGPGRLKKVCLRRVCKDMGNTVSQPPTHGSIPLPGETTLLKFNVIDSHLHIDSETPTGKMTKSNSQAAVLATSNSIL